MIDLDIEGEIARIGAVTAALSAREPLKALQLIDRYRTGRTVVALTWVPNATARLGAKRYGPIGCQALAHSRAASEHGSAPFPIPFPIPFPKCRDTCPNRRLDWKEFVEIDTRYNRPTEVDLLLGDASKAKKLLG